MVLRFGDVDLVEDGLYLFARDVLAREIDEHQVIVRAARDDAGITCSVSANALARRSPLNSGRSVDATVFAAMTGC